MSLVGKSARILSALSLGLSILAAPRPMHAQRLEPAAVAQYRPDSPTRRFETRVVDTAVKKPPSVWWFVGGGAVLGAGTAALGFALDESDDAILYGVVVAVVVPASAVLGAGVGWLIHRAVY